MDSRTAAAFDVFAQPGEVRAFGERLQRLTLRHVFVLRVAESPLMGVSRNLELADAVFAARVLGARSEEDLMRGMTATGRWWGRRRIEWQTAWALRNWARDYLRLRAHLDGETEGMPELLPGPGQRSFQTDWVVMLAAKVMREEKCGRLAAWWTPLGEAAHLRLAWEEMDGKEFRVLTDDLREELKELGHEL